jgi:hypothetical protein
MKAHYPKCGTTAIATAVACLMVVAAAFLPNARAQTAQPSHPMARFGRFAGAELFLSGKVVTGAPYSAQIVVEHFQTLTGGNTIHTTTTENVYRDSQGRTRREMTVGAVGPLAGQGAPQRFIFISDPVSGTRHVLNPDRLEARQTQFRAHERPGGNANAPRQGEFRDEEWPGPPAEHAGPGAANPNLKTESLGTQTIENLSVQGTRITRTIPAGQIGNQQAIVIVTERWYSPELQTDVLRRQIDPRFGQTTMQLTNVVRAEPDASLFQVPSEYTVKKGRPLAND